MIALRLLIAHAEKIELCYAASADGFEHMAQLGACSQVAVFVFDFILCVKRQAFLY